MAAAVRNMARKTCLLGHVVPRVCCMGIVPALKALAPMFPAPYFDFLLQLIRCVQPGTDLTPFLPPLARNPPPPNGTRENQGSTSTPFMTAWLEEPTAAYGLRTPTLDAWTSGLESALGTSFDGGSVVQHSTCCTQAACFAAGVSHQTNDAAPYTIVVPAGQRVRFCWLSGVVAQHMHCNR